MTCGRTMPASAQFYADRVTCKACDTANGVRYCTNCAQMLPLEAFDRNRRNCSAANVGRASRCKPCHQALYKAAHNLSRIRREFGLTESAYHALLARAGDRCEICGRRELRTKDGKRTAMHIDHSHKTGRVRGLLCVDCNLGLGRFKDDPTLLACAIAYLSRTT